MDKITDTKKFRLGKVTFVSLLLGGFIVATFIGVLTNPTVAGATYESEDGQTEQVVEEDVVVVIDEESEHESNGEEEKPHSEDEEHKDKSKKKEPKYGSIAVCKTIVDSEGNIVNGEGLSGTFSIGGLDFNNPAGILPVSPFSAPLAFNTDIFAGVDGDDAKCYIYKNLPLGSYYYGEEDISSETNFTPLYNDQHTAQVNSLSDFFPYSGELFNDDESDDGERNTNSDGHIVLSEERPDRALLLLNTYEAEIPPAPYCGDGVVNQEIEECDSDAGCTVECTFVVADNSCPFSEKEGRTIIDFQDGDKIRSDNGDNISGPIDVDILAGTYTVSLASFDGYENRSSNSQPQEIWTLQLKDGSTFVVGSTPSTDLPDNVDYVAQIDVVDNALVVPIDTNKAKAYHAASEDAPSANSVEPVCAALDLVVENNKPIITRIGEGTVAVVVGDSYTDEGATANDVEDGDITSDIIVGGDTVDTNTIGTYTVTYNVADSEGLDANEITRTVIVKSKAVNPKQCSDGEDNDGDGLIDTEDPGCYTDGDPTNSESYDPNDDDETNEIPYAPYCGDEVVNQEWEACDGGLDCTAQCQFSNQCVELAFARVNTDEFKNDSNGDVTSDIFLGSLTNKIPGSVWFLLYNNGTYVVDDPISSYEDVPGLAVERREGKILTLLAGGHPYDGSKENISGDIEFFNLKITEQVSDDSGNNKLERGFDGIKDNIPNQDEVWLVDGNDTQSFFWLTVTTADDAFFTKYGDAPMCELENEKPVITVLGDDPHIVNQFSNYINQGALANDPEDGDISDDIIVVDNVNSAVLGSYIVTYDVVDSEGLAADTQTREVRVIDPSSDPACSDGEDNDGDGLIDTEDPGCYTDGDPTNSESYDPNDDDENQIPVITLRGDAVLNVVLNGTYTEESADVDDNEDGDIDANLVIAGDVVDTTTLGAYTVTYNAVDSAIAAAVEVTRTINVIEQSSENEIPVITLTGNASVSINVGDTFTDEGATANDVEDGDITSDIIVGGDTVDTNTVGTYTVTYNVDDSEGAGAVEVTRTVTVSNPTTPSCTANCGGGGGGGGGGPIPNGLKIFNEKITVIGEGTALITWNTNKAATSRVVYDDDSQTVSVSVLNFGIGSEDLNYEFTTDIVSELSMEHSVLVTNVNLEDLFYFRPISSDGTRAIGIELSAALGTVTGGVCEQYLVEFIKFGVNNDVNEVLKLQTFLNDFEGNNLEVTGVYDDATFAAVVEFQNKYNGDVLSPWGLTGDTGYVYLTTRKKVNEIYCNFQLDFPLTNDQLAEVNQFKGLLESLEEQGLPLPDTSNVGVAPSAPTFAGGDTNPTVTLTEETEEGEDGSNSLASAIEAVNGEEGGIFSRIGNFFRNLLR